MVTCHFCLKLTASVHGLTLAAAPLQLVIGPGIVDIGVAVLTLNATFGHLKYLVILAEPRAIVLVVLVFYK